MVGAWQPAAKLAVETVEVLASSSGGGRPGKKVVQGLLSHMTVVDVHLFGGCR